MLVHLYNWGLAGGEDVESTPLLKRVPYAATRNAPACLQ